MSLPRWFDEMLGWKRATTKAESRCRRLFGGPYGPNLADLSNMTSTAVAGAVYAAAGIPSSRQTSSDLEHEENIPSSSGSLLERSLGADLATALRAVDPSRSWEVTRSGSVSQFAQYAHLRELQELFESQPTLRNAVGRDYEVSTDVMVALPDPRSALGPWLLHAAVSSKLTIRSDRVQNIRYEFAGLVRNRKGRLPHLVVVTAEPLPSRLVSIARGTGEVDAVYHLMFDEMDDVLNGEQIPGPTEKAWLEQTGDWREMVQQQRVRPYAELAAVLAAG